ncbi:MAG: hypothetical protein ACREQ5_00300 [Candidatus Dormibacteria bacterium]
MAKEEEETMKAPQLGRLVPRHPDGRVSTEAVALIAVVVAMTVLTWVVVLNTTHPDLGGFFWFLGLFGLGMSMLSLLDRVIKLERLQKKQAEVLQQTLEKAKELATQAQGPHPGTLEFMVHDAKAAAGAVGYNLAKQEEVAQTILTSCLRRGGTFEP